MPDAKQKALEQSKQFAARGDAIATEAEKKVEQQQQQPKQKRKRGATVDPNETKAQRFTRLGNKRVPRALKAIGSVKNLANTAQYEYTPEQAATIREVLGAAVRSLSDAFTGVKENGPLFRL